MAPTANERVDQAWLWRRTRHSQHEPPTGQTALGARLMEWQDIYEDVNVLDFEFVAADGEQQHPICLVAKSLKTGTETKLWITRGCSALYQLAQSIYMLATSLRLNGTAFSDSITDN